MCRKEQKEDDLFDSKYLDQHRHIFKPDLEKTCEEIVVICMKK